MQISICKVLFFANCIIGQLVGYDLHEFSNYAQEPLKLNGDAKPIGDNTMEFFDYLRSSGVEVKNKQTYIEDKAEIDPHGGPMFLDTALTVEQSVSTFFSEIREVKGMNELLSSKDAYTVILAPTNEAMMKLPKKPWAFPRSTEHIPSIIADVLISRNIKDFVYRHTIAERIADAPFENAKCTDGATVSLLLHSGHAYIECRKDDRTFSSKLIKVIQVDNGAIWVIDTCLSYP
ncbi:hypothetical protein CANCADRAFT_1702 [Tortispora caseinolytica NRRL Y-17796]|uniref:FAS1 domain-containing protein n=1 Tax=Tortispora caseinolytica NRRL Y-17796 TaxID=767744 RepID=A0A1E4TDX0_9ASCO|nr:hypothetical protein CANCADRAFT_1702 [Tortispora caseinolytica NRRL Y-17796]